MHRRKGHGQGAEGGVEHAEDSGHISGQQELDGVLDVAVHVASVGHRFDDGGEIVVRQNHGGRVLGYLSAGDAHGHADIRLF